MLLKGNFKTIYFTDEGQRSETQTDNYVKIKQSVTYRQANMFYELAQNDSFKVLYSGSKKKNAEAEQKAIMELIPVFVKLLSTMIVDWSQVDENGNMIDITPETVEDLEFPIMMELINESMSIISGKQEEAAVKEEEVKN